jgi:hypothetical protein
MSLRLSLCRRRRRVGLGLDDRFLGELITKYRDIAGGDSATQFLLVHISQIENINFLITHPNTMNRSVLSLVAATLNDRVTWLRLGPLCEGPRIRILNLRCTICPIVLTWCLGRPCQHPTRGNKCGMAWICVSAVVALLWNSNTYTVILTWDFLCGTSKQREGKSSVQQHRS